MYDYIVRFHDTYIRKEVVSTTEEGEKTCKLNENTKEQSTYENNSEKALEDDKDTTVTNAE
jgi:hypothetical protein